MFLYFHFSFSIFSDRQSLKIENEINSTKALTTEVSYMGLGSPEFRFIEKLTMDGWNNLQLELIFMVPACSSHSNTTEVIILR